MGMQSSHSMRTIQFTDPAEKSKAFFELMHAKASFNGIGKDTLVISNAVYQLLETKHIKYNLLG